MSRRDSFATRILRCVAAGSFAALLGAVLVATAAAQPGGTAAAYEQLPTPEKYNNATARNEALRRARQILGGMAEFNQENREFLREWYADVMFAEMTQFENLPQIHDRRQQFRSQHFRVCANDAIRAELNRVTLEKMGEIAAGNYHPAARVNAMLLIADLDQADEVRGSTPIPAVPFPPALTHARGLLAAAVDPKQHPAVRVAAVRGVVRHAEAPTTAAAQRDAIRAAMLRILAEPADANTLSADGRTWLHSRAAEALGAIGAPEPAVVKQLAALVADSSATVPLRCAAAKALGQLKFTPMAAIDGAAAAGALGNLALDACREELVKSQRQGRKASGRVLYQQFSAILAGLTNVATVANNQVLGQVTKQVQDLLQTASADGANLAVDIQQKSVALSDLLETNNLLKVAPSATPTAAPAPTAVPAGASADE